MNGLAATASGQPGAAVVSVLAHNLGGTRAKTRAAQGDWQLVADQSTATVGENRREAHQTCPVPLVVPGGESSDARVFGGMLRRVAMLRLPADNANAGRHRLR